MSQQSYPAHQIKDVSVVFFPRAPRTPTQAFLQWSAVKLGETDPDRVRQRDIIYVKPFRRPILGRLFWGSGWVSGPSDAPYFGPAHLINGPLLRTGHQAGQPLPQRKMSLDA